MSLTIDDDIIYKGVLLVNGLTLGGTAGDTTDDTLDLTGTVLTVNLATVSTDGVMSASDKLKLDGITEDSGSLLAGPLGTVWGTGLAVTANSPVDQAIDISAGTFFISAIEYTHAGTANFSLAADFTALTAGQKRTALIYIDATNVVQRVLGAITTASNKAIAPAQPANSVCLAFVLIDKNQNNIATVNITDCRTSLNTIDTDELVKISSADTTGKYLSQALSNNGNVDFTIENVGANETLRADVDLSTKQNTLVSGTNIKTVNGNTLLGSGDLVVAPQHNTVNAAGNITTTSLTAVIVTGMTLTPGAGTYLVFFNSDILHSSTTANTTMQIHANGTLVANSARVYRLGSVTNRASVALQAVAIVGAGQAIDVRWFTSVGTATLGNRILTLIKVG